MFHSHEWAKFQSKMATAICTKAENPYQKKVRHRRDYFSELQSPALHFNRVLYTFCLEYKKGDTPLLNASSAASATAYKNELISYLYNGLTSYRLYQRENPLIKNTYSAATVAALPKQTISIKLNRKQEKHYHHPEQQRKSSQNSVHIKLYICVWMQECELWVCCIQCI